MPVSLLSVTIPAGVSGSINVTDPAKLGGAVPAGAILLSSTVPDSTGDEAAHGGARMSIGFSEGDGAAEYSLGVLDRDAAATASTARSTKTGDAFNGYINGSSSQTICGVTALIADGVTIAYSNVAGSDYEISVLVVYGPGAALEVGTYVQTVVETQVALGIGEPDLVFCVTNGGTANLTSVFSIWSMGIAVNDGVATQKAWRFSTVNGADPMDTASQIATGQVGGQTTGASSTWVDSITQFNATGFKHQSSANGTDDMIYCAIKLAEGDTVDLVHGALPVAAGPMAIAGLTETPSFGLIASAYAAPISTLGGDGGGIIGVFDAADVKSYSCRSEVAVGDSNTHSTKANKALYGLDNAEAEEIDIAFTGFAANTANLNVLTAPATAYPYLALFIGQAAGAGGATLGAAVGTESAVAIEGARARSISEAAGVDAALPIASVRVRSIGTAAAADAALPPATARRRVLDLAASTDIALPISTASGATLGTPVVADQALPLSTARTDALSLAAVADTALALSYGRAQALAPAVDTIQPLPITGRRIATLDIAEGYDQALALIQAAGDDFIRFTVDLPPVLAVAAIGSIRAVIQRAA